MVAELDILNEWIPDQMQPGTVFVLENAGEVGEKEDPYWAMLACPSCGMLGLITRRQINGLVPVICGSEQCSAQFFIREGEVGVRKPVCLIGFPAFARPVPPEPAPRFRSQTPLMPLPAWDG